jgi:hypothetical protein
MRGIPWSTIALGSLLLISVCSKGGQEAQSPQPENSKPPAKTEQRGRILGIGGVFFKSATPRKPARGTPNTLGLRTGVKASFCLGAKRTIPRMST